MYKLIYAHKYIPESLHQKPLTLTVCGEVTGLLGKKRGKENFQCISFLYLLHFEL